MSPNNKPADDAAQLSGAYALNALSAVEREQLEAHMAGNEQTRNEVTELTDTAVLLGLAVSPEAPPASLKASIMAQLASTPQLPVEPAQTPASTPAAVPGAVERRATERWFTRPVAALAAAAASVLLIVGGGVITTSITTNNYLDAQAGQLAAINAADDSQRKVVALDGGGTATLVWSGQLASSALIVDGLEPLPTTHVYELWYIDSAGARPAGTFTTDSGGNTWRVLEGSMAAGDTVGVTVEPRGGSDVPTTDPVIVIASA